MKRLLKIEFRKLVKSRAFVVIGGMYLLAMIMGTIGMGNFEFTQSVNGQSMVFNLGSLGVFDFPYIWHNTAYVGGLAKYMLALLVVLFVCSEFTYRTSRQNVIDGLSRNEFMLSKLLGIFVLSAFSALVIGFVTLILGYTQSQAHEWDSVVMGMPFLFAYFMEVFGYLVLAMFFSVVFRRTGVAIILLMVYSFIIEPILYWQLPESIEEYLPLQSINGMIEFPFKRYLSELIELEVQNSVSMAKVGWSAAWTFIFYLGVLSIFRKRDL